MAGLGAGCSSPQSTLHTCHSTAPSPPRIHGTSLHGHAILAAAPSCDRSFHTGSGASAGQAAHEGQKQEKWPRRRQSSSRGTGDYSSPIVQPKKKKKQHSRLSKGQDQSEGHLVSQHLLILTVPLHHKRGEQVWGTLQLFQDGVPKLCMTYAAFHFPLPPTSMLAVQLLLSQQYFPRSEL